MRRKLGIIGLFLVMLLSSFLISCAQASSTWSQTYCAHWGTDAFIGTSDGGYAIAGGFGYQIEGTYTGSGSLTRVDFFLTKLDSNGVLQWTQRYSSGERGDAEAISVVQTSDSGYALVGRVSDSVRSYDGDVWLVKTDSSGKLEWSRTYDEFDVDFGSDVIQTSDRGFAIIGGSYGNGDPKGTGFWLMKTDASGNIQWNETYGTQENYESACSLVEALDGGYALVGNMYNFSAGRIWLVKVDPIGNMEWNQTFAARNSTATGGPQALVATSDGGYALIGSKIQPNTTTYGAIGTGWLIKTNALGEEEWNQTFGTSGSDDDVSALIQTPDGGYMLAGARGLFDPATKGDVWLIKTDPEGNILWNKTYGGLPDVNGQYHMDRGFGLTPAPDGGYAILAETEYPAMQDALVEGRIWLIKTDCSGTTPALSDTVTPIPTPAPIPPPKSDLWIVLPLTAAAAAFLAVTKFMKRKA